MLPPSSLCFYHQTQAGFTLILWRPLDYLHTSFQRVFTFYSKCKRRTYISAHNTAFSREKSTFQTLYYT